MEAFERSLSSPRQVFSTLAYRQYSISTLAVSAKPIFTPFLRLFLLDKPPWTLLMAVNTGRWLIGYIFLKR